MVMASSRRRLWLVPLALALLSAGPADTEDLVRQGNAAFEKGDFAAAVRYYDLAEERITDPGLVAFNKAAALYRLGQDPRAAEHDRRGLEAPPGPRRARVLFGLANSLLQQARARDARTLERAVALYRECRAQEGADPDLIADAEYNMELARLLWVKAMANPQDPESNPGPEDGSQAPRPRNTPDPNRGARGGEQAPPAGEGKPMPGDPPDPRQNPRDSDERAPGRGNQPTLPDLDDLTPLSPQETTAYLEEAARRILSE